MYVSYYPVEATFAAIGVSRIRYVFLGINRKSLGIQFPVKKQFSCMAVMVRAMSSSPVVVKDKINLTDVEERIFCQLLDVVQHYRLEMQLRVAGGWVRDKLLRRDCYDIDIALDKMLGREFCEKVRDYIGGEDEGYCVIQSNPEQSKHLETARMRIFGTWIDFVNLRSEKYTESSRIPEMEFGTTTEDAYRRDLTINSLFYNINTGLVEDLTGRGIEDLKSGRIVTPLPPKATFLDDPLRVLRAIRFGARFNFVLDGKIMEATADKDVRAALKEKISRERIGHEVDLMMVDKQPVQAISWIYELGLFGAVFTLPENMELSELEFADQKCVACMNTAWNVLQQVGHLAFSSEERRLYLYGALFYPLRESVYMDKKSKSLPVTAHIFRHSLKSKSSDAEIVANFHETAEKFAPFVKSIESADFEFQTDLGYEFLDISSSARRRVMLGLILRKIKDYWRVALLMSSALFPKPDHIEDSLFASELYRKAESAITELNLDKVWESKPLLDGNAIMGILQVKGRQIGEWQQRILKWQLSHPDGTSDDCRDWMQQWNAKRMKLHYSFPFSPTKLIPFYGGPEYRDYQHYVGGLSQSNFASVFTYCDNKYGMDKGYSRYQKAQLAKIKEQARVAELNGEKNGIWQQGPKFDRER